MPPNQKSRRTMHLTIACFVAAFSTSISAQTPVPGGPPWPENSLRRIGDQRIPVFLVNFSNVSHSYTKTDYLQLLSDGSTTSKTLQNYYLENSYGKLRLSFEFGTPINLPKKDDYYAGGNLSDEDSWQRTWELIAEVATRTNINFEDFDNDGADDSPNSGDDDGFVDTIVIIHPKMSQECNAGETSFSTHYQKAHELDREKGAVPTQGRTPGGSTIYINDYIIVEGLACNGTAIAPIGSLAHELGHALGLPDLEDGDHSSGGIGYWGLMGRGVDGGDGKSPDTPTHLSAWSKARLGWLIPEVLKSPDHDGVHLLDAIETSPSVYQIYIDSATLSGEQYYLLEYRRRVGFDAKLPGDGLLIWRVHSDAVDAWYDAYKGNWQEIGINDDDTVKAIRLEEADGNQDILRWENYGDAGDPFPGSRPLFEFNSTTQPRGLIVTLCNIHETGGQLEFTLKEPNTSCN